jgi:hypothetical protein
LNKDCSDLWVMDMIHFPAIGLRRMNFGMNFLLPELKKMSYICIEMNLFETDLMLQLNISHE